MPAKLLIVDDEAVVAESMRVVLTQLGYDVVGTAGSGAAALELIPGAGPDLVLMDINLGHDQEGIAAAETIRREHRLPVVYVTAYADNATLARAKLSHPFGYVTKPFESRDLHIAIEIALHNHGLEQRLQQSERALGESEGRLRSILNTITDQIWLKDREGRVLAVNRAWCEYFGQEENAVLGKTGPELFPTAVARQFSAVDRRVLTTGEHIRVEEQVPDCHQVLGWFETHKAPLLNDRHEIAGTVGIARNIAWRKQHEAALAEQAETYRALLSTSFDGVLETDENATILDANRAYCELTGYSRAELVGMSIRELEGNETAREVDEHTVRMRREGGDRFESRHRAKDGRRIDVEVSITFVASRRRFVAFLRDISRRQAVERTLRFLATASTAPGEGFFASLARFLATELDMDYVCIDRLETDGLVATTLAVYSNGRFENNLTYALKDTPCGEVVGQAVCCFPTGVRQRFPRDAALGELQAESYVGVTLRGHDNRPIGLIAVIGRRPLKNPALAEEVLQLVTGRAAGELVRAQSEAEIRRLLEFNRGTLDSLSAHLCVLDEAGRILAVNRAWRAFATANPPVATSVVEGANYLEVCLKAAGGERSSALELVRGIQAVARGEMTEYQQEYPCHAPCERRWFIARVTRFFEAGQVRIVVAHVNLTDRKLAELALQESESNYRSLMDQAADGIFIANAQGRYVDVNHAGCELLGRSREEILQLSMVDVVAAEDQAALPVADRLRELNAGRSIRSERQLVRKDGTIVNVEISARRLADGRLQGIHRDVTERRRAEEELRRISRWLFATQRISATGGWAIDLKAARVWASPEARRIYGFGEGELSLPAIQALPLAPYRLVLDRALQELVKEGKPYDVEFQVARRSDGAIADIRSVAEYNAEEHLVLGVLQDITVRKRAEAALRESEEKFSKAFRDSPAGMAIRDLDSGCYLDVNERCLAMTGFTRKEVIGRSPREIGWLDLSGHEERESLLQEPRVGSEMVLRLRHKDGHEVTCSYSSHQVRIGGRACLLSITLDITLRKQLEAEREGLLRDLARKNRELEHLVYVTSHDLRSPMLNIQGFTQRIEERCVDVMRLAAVERPSAAERAELAGILTQQLPKALGYVHTSVDKMDRLIGGLLRLSRLGRAGLRPEKLDLNAMLRDIQDAMAFSIQTTGAEIEVASLPPCHGDAGQINQVFTNLLDNALKYRDPARPLRVTVTGRVEGARAIYCVADTGQGIAAQHRDKIWEIFFRANPEGSAKGEGMGLNLVRRIVERHQGEIWLESTEGEGSRFHVALPLTAENAPAHEAESSPPIG